jgi:hypothetical protein
VHLETSGLPDLVGERQRKAQGDSWALRRSQLKTDVSAELLTP